MFDLRQYLDKQTSNWIQLGFTTPVVLRAGWPFFVRAWESLENRNLDMFTLIAFGTGAAWIYSVVAIAAPAAFPVEFLKDGAVAVYFRGYSRHHSSGRARPVLSFAREGTSVVLSALLDLVPKTTMRMTSDGKGDAVPMNVA